LADEAIKRPTAQATQKQPKTHSLKSTKKKANDTEKPTTNQSTNKSTN
jgi:hypothetical protein